MQRTMRILGARQKLVLSGAMLAVLFAQGCSRPGTQDPVDELLEAGISGGKIPGVIAAAASSEQVIYEGAAGARDVSTGDPMTVDTIVQIASLTKAVTSVAVMQLVEAGNVQLDDPAAEYLPRIADVRVMEGFDSEDQPILRPPESDVTIRQLLTHTSGYVYEFWYPVAARNVQLGHVPSIVAGGDGFIDTPIYFDPGTSWYYGISTDVLGLLIEAVTGQSLGDYFQERIFEPLKMRDSSFAVPDDKAGRLATVHAKTAGGHLSPLPGAMRTDDFESGGGGLYSTALDYVRFMRAILNGGELDGVRILSADSVELMASNHIGDLELPERIPSSAPMLSNDIENFTGPSDKFGLGFMIHGEGFPGGRAAGSLSWAGGFNLYYWIDRDNDICGVVMTQIMPFFDADVLALASEFEKAIYAKVDVQ